MKIFNLFLVLIFIASASSPYIASASYEKTEIEGKILICTGSGFKWVDIKQAKEHHSSGKKCPLCLAQILYLNEETKIFIKIGFNYIYKLSFSQNFKFFSQDFNNFKTRAPPIFL